MSCRFEIHKLLITEKELRVYHSIVQQVTLRSQWLRKTHLESFVKIVTDNNKDQTFENLLLPSSHDNAMGMLASSFVNLSRAQQGEHGQMGNKVDCRYTGNS